MGTLLHVNLERGIQVFRLCHILQLPHHVWNFERVLETSFQYGLWNWFLADHREEYGQTLRNLGPQDNPDVKIESQSSKNIFKFIRPKIGKKFHDTHLEKLKYVTLTRAASQAELIIIGIEEGLFRLSKDPNKSSGISSSCCNEP